jgi:predicted O-methyltransferase YrrM
MKSPSVHRLLATIRRPSLRRLFAVPTHLTDRERFLLFTLARECSGRARRSVNMVEIGSYLGASASFLAAGMRNRNDRVFCIDTWANDAMSEGSRDTFSKFLANTSRHSERIVPIRGWSYDAEVIEEVRRQALPVDLLFIDGDHSYEGALADWRNYAPMLAPGAFVVMHDIGWAEGVQRVVGDEIRPRVQRESRLPNLWWGQLRS